ncbi:MAG TPA: GAF domain-containing sensor histidine kinase [Gemmatimonadaceae bacterium]|nr:GAF domain-containing sensor histidine kinase [Gemmatimonadaceae bacterium]
MQDPISERWPIPTLELRPALELALTLTRADMGVLMLRDETADALLPALGFGLSDEECDAIGSHKAGIGPFGLALTERRRVVIRNASADPSALPALAKRLGFKAIEVLPLFGDDGQTIGALGLMFRQRRTAKPRQAHLVELTAALVVSALTQGRRRQAAESQRAAAEASGRAKVQLIAHMSHELRTPLQSIAGYIELLRMAAPEPLTSSQAYLLDRMLDGEQILVHVVDDLITFSRLETGHLNYELGAVSVREALRVTEAIVAPLAHARGVRLKVDECAADLWVHGDDAKVKQVLVNLATNAVKFTNRDGDVFLACEVKHDDVLLHVSDTGAGIPSDQLSEIFEPYVQLDTPLLDSSGGSGLGLAISREFAAAMHGDLTVSSTVGLGSTFTFRLRRHTPEVDDAAAAVARAEGASMPMLRMMEPPSVALEH